jgi:plastocyanin
LKLQGRKTAGLATALRYAVLLLPVCAAAQPAPSAIADFHAHIQFGASSSETAAPAAVVWLDPADKAGSPPNPGRFTLVQKNRMFTPRLLVIPVGSVVSFPNEDPFFHNVFSLFNGKRFDLGLYEAGTSKEVVFSRVGVSYVFCNIHPAMSAVILTVATPFYGTADSTGKVTLHKVSPGEYVLHAWVQGMAQQDLDRMTRTIQVRPGASNSITLDVSNAQIKPAQHMNKFGQPYDRQASPPY